jgi:hypothetical protein
MNCQICSSALRFVFTAKVLSKYEASYMSCPECGYLTVENPFWLSEAYTEAIASADTGLVMRNISIASKLSGILFLALRTGKNESAVDAAGGYGMLTRLMRDIGFNFYWSDAYCKNLMALGFEYSELVESCSIVTAMEVMEHLEDPVSFIKSELDRTGAKNFIFTTELYSGEPPLPGSWWYYAFETGQHIGFFQKITLEKLAQKLKLNFYSANGMHIFSQSPINKLLFRLATNRFIAPVLMILIRKINGSRTMDDHTLMLRRVKNQ